MATKREYKAVKNFIHNTLGIGGREEIRGMLKDVVKEIVAEELQKYFQTRAFSETLKQCYGGSKYWYDTAFREAVTKEIHKAVGELVLNQINIEVTPKEHMPVR
jgi:uncharacterized membrane protein YheB (UPF0754 family)